VEGFVKVVEQAVGAAPPWWGDGDDDDDDETASQVVARWKEERGVQEQKVVEQAAVSGSQELSPEFCTNAEKQGYVSVHGNEKSDTILLDLSDAMGGGDEAMKFLVTAMAGKGTFSEDSGSQVMTLSQSMEDSPHQMIEMRLSPDKTEVDVFSPHLSIRTSDEDSEEALRMGMGGGRIGSIPRVLCGPGKSPGSMSVRKMEAGDTSSEKRVLVALDSLLSKGFFAVRDMNFGLTRMSTRISSLKAFPKNLNVIVEQMMAHSNNRPFPITLSFSILRLPDTPMAPRAGDNRLAYFATTYSDLGFHPQEMRASASPSSTVDARRTMIWRYYPDRDEDKQIKIYIDPTVPKRWRNYVKEGIEAWNEGFAVFGAQGTVKAIAPDDKEWPLDYDQGDARYTVVTWVFDTSRVVSKGHARVDPRSGEIMKSEISMSVGWLHAWLSDMDHLAPQLVQRSSAGVVQEERVEMSAEGAASAAEEFADRASHARRVADARAALFGTAQGADSSNLLHLATGSDSRLGLFHMGQPMTVRQQEEVLGAGIKQVIMHEVGHILGLRHNFKGSLGVSYECTQDKACSSKYGLSASVMDYLPINLPENGDPDSVHFFSPVIGEFDKLAIAYGYMPDHTKTLAERTTGEASLSLNGLLNKAESFEVCLDADSSKGEDPQCRPYDFTSDPIRYLEATLDRHRKTHEQLLDTAVAPGNSYFHYGNAASTLMALTRQVGLNAARYIGGNNHSYVHRSDVGFHGGGALHFQSAHTQRRALNVTMQVLQLSSAGLLPPAGSRKFLVRGGDDNLKVVAVDHAAREIQKDLLWSLLSPERLERLFDHSGDCEGSTCPLTVEELLSELVDKFGVPQNAASPDWDLELQLVKSLRFAAKDPRLPADVQPMLSEKLNFIGSIVQALLERGDSLRTWAPRGWQECAEEGGECECHGQMRFGASPSWSELRQAGGKMACSAEAFEDPAPHQTKACQCLSEAVGKEERFHAHLLRLRRELDQDKQNQPSPHTKNLGESGGK
jgi:hypothetical protein